MQIMVWILRGLVALFAAGGVWYWRHKRHHKKTRIDPLQLIKFPEVDASVERRLDGGYVLRWQNDIQLERVEVSQHPDEDWQAAAFEEMNPHEAVIHVSLESRPYFKLIFADGTALKVAERILTFQGVANVRDIGGYRTMDGRYVRWGRYYRTGALGDATPDDLIYLEQMRVKCICDLRSDEEVADKPNRLPPDIQQIHDPVQAQIHRADRYRLLFMKRPHLEELVVQLYTEIIIEQNADVIGRILRQAAEAEHLPVIIHCTAGKDRTGIVTALLLLVLGVPLDVVAADYSLSNYDYDNFYAFAERSTRSMAFLGFTPDDVQPLLLANAQTMVRTVDYINQRYGSVESYLQDMAGISDTIIEQIKRNLLE